MPSENINITVINNNPKNKWGLIAIVVVMNASEQYKVGDGIIFL